MILISLPRGVVVLKDKRIGVFQQFSKPKIHLGMLFMCIYNCMLKGRKGCRVLCFPFVCWISSHSCCDWSWSLTLNLNHRSRQGRRHADFSQFPLQGSWPPTLPRRFIGHRGITFTASTLCNPSLILSHIHWAKRTWELQRTQKCCPILNAMVPVASSETWHLRTQDFLPLWKVGDRRSSHTIILLGPLNEANITAKLRMAGEERSEGRAKEEQQTNKEWFERKRKREM